MGRRPRRTTQATPRPTSRAVASEPMAMMSSSRPTVLSTLLRLVVTTRMPLSARMACRRSGALPAPVTVRARWLAARTDRLSGSRDRRFGLPPTDTRDAWLGTKTTKYWPRMSGSRRRGPTTTIRFWADLLSGGLRVWRNPGPFDACARPGGRAWLIAKFRGPLSGWASFRTFRSCESVWPSRYPRRAVTAVTSKAAIATSVIARTPARTLVRSWARRSRLGIAAIQRSMIRGQQSIVRSQRGRLGLIGTRRFAGAGEPQTVADSALGVDHVRPVAGQLAAQVSDVGRHHRAGAAEVVVPHVVQELRPGQHPPRIEHQVAQQPELRRRQIDQVTPAADLVAVLIKLDVREREHLPVRRTGTGAAQHGTDPGRQLFQPERLGHVVIAAEGQPRHLVGLGIPGGQEDHRNPAAVRAQPADDVEAAGVRQHHVQDDQVERAIPGQPQRAGAGLRGGHLKAQEPQRGSNRVAEERLIIDHQQATAVTGQARHRVTHRLAS